MLLATFACAENCTVRDGIEVGTEVTSVGAPALLTISSSIYDCCFDVKGRGSAKNRVLKLLSLLENCS